MKTSPTLVDLAHIRAELERGCRVALLIRHSERPAIRTDDKDFGRFLGLTPHGIELARTAGARLAGVTDAHLFASPMTRCQATARHFAEGMGIPHPIVTDAEQLGVRGFFYDDCHAVQEHMRRQGYIAYMLDYLRDGTAPASRPLIPAAEQFARWLQQQATARLSVFVSHDIFIAAFLTGLKIRTYTAADWVGFLHGAALIDDPATGWTCHAFAPDLADAQRPSPFAD